MSVNEPPSAAGEPDTPASVPDVPRVRPMVELASLALVTAALLIFAVVIALFAIVVPKDPVPDPVTSPVKVIVWSPVLVPETVASSATVSVFELVPPARVNPTVCGASVNPFTDIGVIFPSVSVIAGVVVGLETVPETPFAFTTETELTVPDPLLAESTPPDNESPEPSVSASTFPVPAVERPRSTPLETC